MGYISRCLCCVAPWLIGELVPNYTPVNKDSKWKVHHLYGICRENFHFSRSISRFYASFRGVHLSNNLLKIVLKVINRCDPVAVRRTNKNKSIGPNSETSQTSWWFQPLWKNISQIGSFPQVGMKIKHIWNQDFIPSWNHHSAKNWPLTFQITHIFFVSLDWASGPPLVAITSSPDRKQHQKTYTPKKPTWQWQNPPLSIGNTSLSGGFSCLLSHSQCPVTYSRRPSAKKLEYQHSELLKILLPWTSTPWFLFHWFLAVFSIHLTSLYIPKGVHNSPEKLRNMLWGLLFFLSACAYVSGTCCFFSMNGKGILLTNRWTYTLRVVHQQQTCCCLWPI